MNLRRALYYIMEKERSNKIIFIRNKLDQIKQALNIKVDENSLHDGLYDIKLTYKIFEKILKSKTLFKEFTEENATELYNQNLIDKAKEVYPTQKFTEENAWIQV